ncbi:MAG: hypothetical protein WBK91_11020 [Alphaproteobacteria bacterium]
MVTDYVHEKSMMALRATEGDMAEAQKLLVSWAARDQTLLLGLAKPHLKAMAQFALEQAGRHELQQEMPGDIPAITPEMRRALMDQAGLRRQGMPNGTPEQMQKILDPGRQTDTWHAIAAAFKKKKPE